MFAGLLVVSACAVPAGTVEVFTSDELGVSFDVPYSLDECEETITDISGDRSIENYTPRGFQYRFVCGSNDFIVEAVSRDHLCYEFCTSNQYPTEAEDYTHSDAAVYDYENLTVRIADNYWGFGGEDFFIGTYYPLNGEKYDTFRVSSKLKPVDNLERIEDIQEWLRLKEEYRTDYLEKVKAKDLPQSELVIVNNFEQTLSSIQVAD